MTQTIRLKKSDVPDKKPQLNDLVLGELAVNSYDGKIYLKKKQGGVEEIVDIQAGSGSDGTGRPAGDIYTVQINGGNDKFEAVPVGDAGRVLTSNGTATPTWEPVPVSGGTVRSVDINGGSTGLAFNGGPVTTIGTFIVDGTLSISHGGTGAINKKDAMINLLPTQTGFTNAALFTDGSGNLSWAIPPGVVYQPGAGITFVNDTTIVSTVADNTGVTNRLTVTNGDGTLTYLPAGTSGYVLTSNGSGLPTWAQPLGTVSDIRIFRNTDMGLYISGGDVLNPPVADTRQITTTGTISLAGVLRAEYGGTNATSILGARTNLLPSQASNGNKVLVTTGTDVYWGEGLPPQGGNSGNMLVTNGVTASWVPATTGGTVTSISGSGGTTGLTLSGGPITTSGTLTLGGVLGINNGGTGGLLPISKGGTGATTAQDARNALLPSQAGKVGLILTTDGTDVSWTSASAGSVTSVDGSGGTTGLTFTGGPITGSGTLTLGGVLGINNGGTGGLLPITKGGTGATTADAAFKNLSPATAAGDIIYSNGTTNVKLAIGTTNQVLTVTAGLPTWKDPVGGGSGSVTSVNASGGSTGLTFSGGPVTSTGTLTLGGVLEVNNGGTGSGSRSQAFLNLAPEVAGHNGEALIVTGSSVSWKSLADSGAITSVNGGSTGLQFSTTGFPVGMTVLQGTLSIPSGGTGATTAQGARTSLLPDQSGKQDKVLLSDGTDVYWGNTNGSGTVTSVGIDPATTGLTFSGGPITSDGQFLVGGTLNIANGGTGGTSAQQARNNLLPPQATHDGQILVTNGTDAYWSDAAGSGTVTSVNASGGSTGLTFTGGPVTTIGVLELGGTLAVSNGGTGGTTAAQAVTNLLPSQTGNSGRVLSTNGTTVSWLAPSALDVAAGTSGQLQFKSPTTGLAATADLAYNTSTRTLTGPNLVVETLRVTTGVTNLTGGVVSNTITLGTPAITPAQGNFFIYTVASVTTWTIGAVTNNAYSLTLKLINGGGAVQNWPANVYWAGGAPPVLTSGATKYDLIFLTTMDGGTTYQGASLINFDLP